MAIIILNKEFPSEQLTIGITAEQYGSMAEAISKFKISLRSTILFRTVTVVILTVLLLPVLSLKARALIFWIQFSHLSASLQN
ncbi:hypothetical protein DMH27_02015 [Raoultella planticola]|nr:hypothetical protein [Raoultella planticola]